MTNTEVLMVFGGLLLAGFIWTFAKHEITWLKHRVSELEAQMQPGYQIPDCVDWVGTGWVHILEDLHTQISVIDPHYRVSDLKEKFGALRVDFTCGPEYYSAIRALVTAAENRSCGTCEFCGEPGETRFPYPDCRGWAKTVCDKHHALRSKAE